MNPEVCSIEELAGQRLMIGFEGTSLSGGLRFAIESMRLGGVILFSGNIRSPDQLKELCTDIQACGRSAGLPPLFIAVDQEGGSVARLREPFTVFPGASRMVNEQDFGRISAEELGGVGINMNMAPVMDVVAEGADSIMADRSFGWDPRHVSAMGVRIIENLQKRGVMAVAKHFPGIGRTVLDSHLDLPVLNCALNELEASDLIPFRAAVARRVAGMMMSHIFYKNIDPKWPASLSAVLARDLLRGRMGYDGLIITDDLDMGAIKKHFDIPTVVHRILSADIDIVLICHEGPDIERAYEQLLMRLSGKAEMLSKGRASVGRILNLKRGYLGLGSDSQAER